MHAKRGTDLEVSIVWYTDRRREFLSLVFVVVRNGMNLHQINLYTRSPKSDRRALPV